MSIEAGSTYEAFTFYTEQGNNPLWTIQGPLSGDLVAGLLVALNVVMDDLNENFDVKYGSSRAEIIGERGRFTLTIYMTDIGPFLIALQDYKILIDREKDVREIMAEGSRQPRGNYAWWVTDVLAGIGFELFTFSSADFVQGFISMMNAFNVDFRDYTLGPPFKYEDDTREPTYYSVEGYDIEPIPENRREAPPTPFYAGAYEVDPGGEDYI